MTLPLSILQNDSAKAGVKFIPDLPADKLLAIHALRMGNVRRINLQFRERFWEAIKIWDEAGEAVSFADAGFFHFPGLPFPTWWTQLPLRAPLLVGWVGAPQADRLDDESTPDPTKPGSVAGHLIDQAVASLAGVFNLSEREIKDQLRSARAHDWRNDPFSLGAYSYVPVDGLSAQAKLAAPLGDKLFFAGEAMSIGHIGTVHGAIQSGRRAAREVLAVV